MAVTSITINGLEVNDGITYISGAPMLSALRATTVKTPVMLEMQNNTPWFVRYQPKAREFPLIVYLLEPTYQLRAAAWDALAAALDVDVPFPVSWTENGDTHTLLVVTSDAIVPDTYFNRASGTLQAPDAVPV